LVLTLLQADPRERRRGCAEPGSIVGIFGLGIPGENKEKKVGSRNPGNQVASLHMAMHAARYDSAGRL